VVKKTSQALNDLSSCFRVCKQSACANRLVLLGGERPKEVWVRLTSYRFTKIENYCDQKLPRVDIMKKKFALLMTTAF